MKPEVIQKIKAAPKEPGVYIFHGKKGTLYVGKAANLRARLKSYLPAFGGSKITDLKTASLDQEATRLEYIPLRSEIEALIEESRLIKELKPKYNIIWRDDKSYLYVYFTKDVFPKVFIGHEKQTKLVIRNSKLEINGIGPFTDGGALRLVMKLLRRFFPYCTCSQSHLRDCLNAQIGKCFGFCCKKTVGSKQTVGRQTYARSIRAIKTILRGNNKKILKVLKSKEEKIALEKIFEHKSYVQTEENAFRHQNKFFPAKNFSSPSTVFRSVKNDNDRTKQNRLRDVSEKQFPLSVDLIKRVECYDNSNFAGKEAVGAMTVLIKKDGSSAGLTTSWQPDKASYRKFKIKSTPTRDDPRMIGEVLRRRLSHPEWPYPDLIIIDGGLTQYRAAKRALDVGSKMLEVGNRQNVGREKLEVGDGASNIKHPTSNVYAKHPTSHIQLISMAKPQKQIYGLKPNSEATPISELPPTFQRLIEEAIYRTHNFAIRYHRQVRRKEFLD